MASHVEKMLAVDKNQVDSETSDVEAATKTEPSVDTAEPEITQVTVPLGKTTVTVPTPKDAGKVKKASAEFTRMTGSTDFAAFRAWREAKKKVKAGEEPELRKFKELLQPHVDNLMKELGKMKDDIVKNANDNASMLKSQADENTWKLAKFQEQIALGQNYQAEKNHQELMSALRAVAGGTPLQALAGSSTDKPAMMIDKAETTPTMLTNEPVNESGELSIEQLAAQVKQMKADKKLAADDAKKRKKDDAEAAKRRKLEAEFANLKK